MCTSGAPTAASHNSGCFIVSQLCFSPYWVFALADWTGDVWNLLLICVVSQAYHSLYAWLPANL